MFDVEPRRQRQNPSTISGGTSPGVDGSAGERELGLGDRRILNRPRVQWSAGSPGNGLLRGGDLTAMGLLELERRDVTQRAV